jgi:DNA-directed RNA polymerase specialized sigma24 family protein
MEVTRRDACDERRVHRMVKPWVPTQDALDKLLAWLDPDRDAAGEKYEHIRRVLTRFFERRGCERADERVDKTINTVTRRIAEGEQVRSPDPGSFFHGVAKNVYLESLRERSAAGLDGVDPPAARPASRSQACLEECLGRLPADSRELLEAYYLDDDREGLARRLGITLNALRLRVFKEKKKLRPCVERCLEAERR